MKRMIFVAAVAVVLVVGAVGAWVVQRYEDLSANLTEYNGVKIGESRDEVHYRLGDPDEVSGLPQTTRGLPGWESIASRMYLTNASGPDINRIPTGKTINDFDDWTFDRRGADGTTNLFNGSLDATFKANRVLSIKCIEFEVSGYCSPIFGIKDDATEEFVRHKIGRPTNERIDATSGIKYMTYADLGLELWLSKGKVYAITTTGGRPGFSWRLFKAAFR